MNLNVLDGDFVKLSRNDIEVNHLNPWWLLRRFMVISELFELLIAFLIQFLNNANEIVFAVFKNHYRFKAWFWTSSVFPIKKNVFVSLKWIKLPPSKLRWLLKIIF